MNFVCDIWFCLQINEPFVRRSVDEDILPLLPDQTTPNASQCYVVDHLLHPHILVRTHYVLINNACLYTFISYICHQVIHLQIIQIK